MIDIDFTDMIGRKLAAVTMSDERDVVTFSFAAGPPRSFCVDGECCSSSWIEHLEMPGNIAGATLIEVVDSAPITQDHADHDDGGEDIKVYNTAFRTDRGDIVLEFRNSSNGYYGGYLVDAKETP